jgi:predicted amidohydrolase YtcJ
MSADLVLINGNIHTMDDALPHVEALAIAGEQIVGIGGNEAMRALLADDGREIDLEGRTVTPGFIDAHLHFLSYGLSLAEIDLMNVPSLAMALERVAVRAAEAPAGQWLTGRGWDQVLWEGQQFPSKADLDAVTPDQPAFCAASAAMPAGPTRMHWPWPASTLRRPTRPAARSCATRRPANRPAFCWRMP